MPGAIGDSLKGPGKVCLAETKLGEREGWLSHEIRPRTRTFPKDSKDYELLAQARGEQGHSRKPETF